MNSTDTSTRGFTDRLEENLMAFLLGVMTLVTFANVVARMLNSNILWALETTVFLFAWLVLIGASYAVKKNFHIGVDVLVQLLPPAAQRLVTLLAVAVCIAFSLLLLKGSWDYWWPFANQRAFYEVNDIPMPAFLQFFADWLNEGERYEKMPRFIPYVVMPLSTLLLTWRFLQVGVRVWTGEQRLIIDSHDVEIDESAAAGDGESMIADPNRQSAPDQTSGLTPNAAARPGRDDTQGER